MTIEQCKESLCSQYERLSNRVDKNCERVISAIKLATVLAVAAASGCAAQQKCDSTASEVQSQNDSADDQVDVHDNGWTAFEKKYKLSNAESALLEPLFSEYGAKILPYMGFILTDENRSLSLVAAFAENPVTEGSYLRLEEIILTHEHLNAEVYGAMGAQMKYESSRLLLIGAMQSGNFKDDVFVREYGRTNSYYGYDLETLVAIFKSSQYSERIFFSLANIRGFSILPPTFSNRSNSQRIAEYAHKLALKDPNVLYDFEDAVLALSKANGRNNPTTIQNDPYYELLRLFDANGSDDEFSFNNIAVKAEVAKLAVLINDPKDHENILDALKPVLDSDHAEELKRELIENIRNKNYVILLGGVAKNSEFDINAIDGLKDAAAECGEYTYVLASYLEHQDLKNWRKAFNLVKKYAKYKKAQNILDHLAAYFSSGAFDFISVREVIALSQKDDKVSFYRVFEKDKCDAKALKFASQIVDETSDPDEENSDRQNTINSFAELVGRDLFYTWMLDYAISNGNVAQTAVYLNFVLNKEEMKEVSSYDRAVELGCELKLECDNPIIYTNLAYGIKVYGEEKVKQLYHKYGIRFFSRYKKDVLEKMLSNAPKRKIPLLAIYTLADWNGAFVEDDVLRQFEDDYDITVVETGSESDVFRWLSSMKSGLALIEAHGADTGISIGNGSGEKSVIDKNDKGGMDKMSSAPPQIILDSCNTGKNASAIGAFIAERLHTQVFAPNKSAAMTGVRFHGGKVISVQYHDAETSVFDFTKR